MARPATTMQRLQALALELPEAERVDIEAWDGEPTFRVRGKNFVFSNRDGDIVTVKLPKDEAEAVVASDDAAEPCGYGLGRHGWITYFVPSDADADTWEMLREWVRTSYTLVAPKKLARVVLEEDGVSPDDD